MYIADTLSRAYTEERVYEQQDLSDEVVMVHALEISDGLRTKLNEEHATDEEMVQLVRAIKEGFVQHKSSTTPLLRPYWNIRERLFNRMGSATWMED